METRRTESAASGTGGFTLVEVMIALVILAVGLLGLEALGIGAARMVNRSRLESQYVALATGRLERSLASIRAGGTGALPDTTVQRDVVRVQVASTLLSNISNQRRFDVTVTVTPQDRGWITGDSTFRVVGSVIR